jgi:hypothetical protein
MSDLVTGYGPQATTRFTMPSFSPIQTQNLYIRMSVNKEKELRKTTEISASLTFLTLPMEQR